MISPTSPARAPVFAVIIHEKGGAERRETFETTELTVGRVQGNELMLPKGNVSKRHARLLYRDGRFIVTDLNSTNGTYVNRRRITQATIVREGDRIYVGDFVLRIELGAPEGEAAPAPRPELVSAEEISTTGPAPAAAPGSPSVRPAVQDDEEQTRSPLHRTVEPPPRPPSSAAASDSPQRPSTIQAQETTGTHQRATQDDALSTERSAVTELIAFVVQSVVDRLGEPAFEPPLLPDLGERVEPILREAASRALSRQAQPPGIAPERLVELARNELLELGPLGDLLRDASVSAIGVVRFDQLTVLRGGRAGAVEPGFSSERALGWTIGRLRSATLADATENELRLDGGLRVSIDPGERGRGASVLVRRGERGSLTLDELVRRGAISRAMATFFRHCLAVRLNLLVVGPRDGAAEQLLSALVGSQGDARVVWVGEAPGAQHEARLDGSLSSAEARRALALKAGMPAVRFAAQLSTAEVAAAVTELVVSGVDGALALRHAPSSKRALLRLAAEIATARPGIGLGAARELVAGAYDVVVEVARLRDERVRVLRVSELTGVRADEIELQEVFTFVPDRTAAGGAVEGTFVPSGNVPHLVETMRARGENLDSAIFSRPPSR